MKKIIIIGAGPVGCFLAQLLKNYGFRPTLIEEHEKVGRPVHCTGLVGSKLFKQKWPIPLPRECIINKIDGAIVNYDRQKFVLKRECVAYVINRYIFDSRLSRGLDIVFRAKFIGLEKKKSGYLIDTTSGEFSADIVIGADGADSSLRPIVDPNFKTIRYNGVQFRVKLKDSDRSLVRLYLMGSYFFWIVPETNGVVRIGTISGNPYQDLLNFMKAINIKGEVIEKFAGTVSLGTGNTVRGNLAIVGGAACQIKPLSYGGIYYGLRCAQILADCISKGKLWEYERLWKRAFLRQIAIGLRISQLYAKLSHQDLKRVFIFLKGKAGLIEQYGDFEDHAGLILKIAKEPDFYRNAGGVLWRFLNMLIDTT